MDVSNEICCGQTHTLVSTKLAFLAPGIFSSKVPSDYCLMAENLAVPIRESTQF
jgi:hypothetical protein